MSARSLERAHYSCRILWQTTRSLDTIHPCTVPAIRYGMTYYFLSSLCLFHSTNISYLKDLWGGNQAGQRRWQCCGKAARINERPESRDQLNYLKWILQSKVASACWRSLITFLAKKRDATLMLTHWAVEKLIRPVDDVRQVAGGIAGHCAATDDDHEEISACCDDYGQDGTLGYGLLRVLKYKAAIIANRWLSLCSE